MEALTTSPRTTLPFSLEIDQFCGIWMWCSAFDVKKPYLSSRLSYLRRVLGSLDDSFLCESECCCYVKFQPNVKLQQSKGREGAAFSKKYSEPLGKGTSSKYNSEEHLQVVWPDHQAHHPGSFPGERRKLMYLPQPELLEKRSAVFCTSCRFGRIQGLNAGQC